MGQRVTSRAMNRAAKAAAKKAVAEVSAVADPAPASVSGASGVSVSAPADSECTPPPYPVLSLRSIADLKAAPYNPRKIKDKAFAGLKTSLGEFGDLSGIVWNAVTGHLVAGHQRMRALREEHGDGLRLEAGAIHTPAGDRFAVRVVEWPLEREKMANVVANNPHIAGEFTEELAPLLNELRETDLADLLEPLAMDKLLDGDEEKGPSLPAEAYEVIVTCGSEDEQRKLFERMKGEGHKCRVVTF
jgi:hypothetical protein